MSTTKTAFKRHFEMSSMGLEELNRALFAFFGSDSLYYQIIPEMGFCVAASSDGPANIMMFEDGWTDPTPASLPKINTLAIEWLDGLSKQEKLALNTSRPNGSYHGDRLVGFKATSWRTANGHHEVLVIVPGWV